MKGRPWTPEERAQACELVRRGDSIEDIGAVLDRTPGAVRNHLGGHGLSVNKLRREGRKERGIGKRPSRLRKRRERAPKLLAYLRANPGATYGEVRQAFDENAALRLSVLFKQGDLVREGRCRRMRYYVAPRRQVTPLGRWVDDNTRQTAQGGEGG